MSQKKEERADRGNGDALTRTDGIDLLCSDYSRNHWLSQSSPAGRLLLQAERQTEDQAR